MNRRDMLPGAFLSVAALASTSSESAAADAMSAVALKQYNVTIRVFDPNAGLSSGLSYILPVRSPDAEHAAASTLANAASFTKKTNGSSTRSVAFCCTHIELAK